MESYSKPPIPPGTIKIESKDEFLPIEDPFKPNKISLLLFEDALVLSYLTTACVCCDEKVEIRAMDEHLLNVHKVKLFHEGLKCAPCDTNFLFEPTRNPLQPYRYDNRSAKILNFKCLNCDNSRSF